MDRNVKSVPVFLILLLLLGYPSAYASWVPDGVPLAPILNPLPGEPRITSDGLGGAIITWQDDRSGNSDIYAQRIDADGSIHAGWTVDGVLICSDAASQSEPRIVSDGSGGAIITWHDYRNGNWDIYAQRVDGDGSIHTGWTAQGEPICTDAASQRYPRLTSDGSGGSIITWEDFRNGNRDVYAQRIDADGSTHTGWASNGEPICTYAESQEELQIISDGSGGAIITWGDRRNGVSTMDIYTQRIDADGSIHAGWTAGGEPVCTDSAVQMYPRMTSDVSGGAVISWLDSRNGNYDVYAQRIDADGSIHTGWTVDGEPVCTNAEYQYNARIASDGSGGAIVAWYDYRGGYSYIFAQRIDANGNISAGWQADGETVCDVSNCQNPRIISDGSGGAIIAWEDGRSGNWDIYAQRIDADGNIHAGWTVGGEPICNSLGDQEYPRITSNGTGGAVIAWHDYRDDNGNIYAKRIDEDGNIHAGWGAYGEPVCTYTEGQEDPQIISDRSGGAIITWRDVRNANYDIYAQRIDVDGSIHAGWTTNGLPVCTKAGNQEQPQITSDGSGGAIIAWSDYRSGNYDIYAQRIDSDGAIHAGWQVDGEPVCTDTSGQVDPLIIPDGSGGAIIAWSDYRNGNADIYAQRIDGGGNIHAGWTVDGEPVCTYAEIQYAARMTSDGFGGAIITWEDSRNADSDIYAQRIDATGNIPAGWQIDGEPVCTYATNQHDARITSDSSGGAFITWYDYRNGNSDIYAQKIDSDGSIHTGWAVDGQPVCTYANSQMNPMITSDGLEGAIITWQDYRNGNFDIYAQRIDGDGNIHAGWAIDAEPVCTNTDSESDIGIVSDASGGAVITWRDDRNGNNDIYAQRVDADGSIHNGWQIDGEPICSNTEEQSDPRIASDGSGAVLITWKDTRSGNNEIYAQRVPDIGLGPVCEVTPTVIDIADTVQVGGYTDTTFTISNVGVGELQGSVIELCDQFDVVSGSGQYSLLNGQSHTVTVRFAPTEAGVHQCTIETGTYICSDVTVTGIAYLCPPDSVLYVDADAFGACDGTSWADAFTDLKEGLARADLCGSVTQIWVAEGTYYPTSGSERDSTFRLRDNLALYGGFAGTESELSERDLSSSTTILSGDIGAAGDINDNSYHVVTGSYTDSTAVLDGFTITAGHASVVAGTGGGMYSEEGSPTLRNLIFRQNKAREYGGGMYNRTGSAPRLYNCVFFDNTAEYYGGGICNIASSPVLVNCSFCRNKGHDGGAALYNNTGSNPTVTNVVMWADSADFMGLPEILNQNSSLPVISYSCIQYCGGSGTGWEGKYGLDGGNNTDRDADYVDMATGDLHLLEGSYASDAGDSTVYGLPATDIEGNPRIQDYNIDMGAYEGEYHNVRVDILGDPSHVDVTVDGEPFVTPCTFYSRSGAEHEIGTTSPQVYGDIIYSFTGWSDAGDTVHNVTLPVDDVAYTAYFSWAAAYASIDSIVDVPEDQGGWVRVHFHRSHYDDASETTYPIERYDMHRRVDDLELAAAVLSEGARAEEGYILYEGRRYVLAKGSASSEKDADDGLLSAAPPGVWEVVGTVSASQRENYIGLAPTLADSAATIQYTAYYISAHSTTPAVYFDSPADSGYSVDNIAPGVPLGMAVAYNTGSGNEVSWDPSPEPDFQHYRIYRGESEDFVPAPGNLAHETAEESWSDPEYDGCDVYYKVTALDHAGNESVAASPETITGDDTPSAPKAFALYQNIPNPFNPVTTIRFDLPKQTHVKLHLYNSRGELVAMLADGVMSGGRKEVVWTGHDSAGRRVASGIYFYRLTAGEFVETRKMVLLR